MASESKKSFSPMLIYCNGIIFHLGFKDSGFSPPLIHLGNIKNVDFCPICPSPSERRCANLTDVTLADQATNSIQADNANMAIQGNVAMKVTQSSGQLWNQCKRRHPLTKF